jgi:signal transduction histidine kinase
VDHDSRPTTDVIREVPAAETFEDKLWALAQAAIVINSQRSVDQMLSTITDQARKVIGAHQASTSLTVEGTGAPEGWPQRNISVSLSPAYEPWNTYTRASGGSPMYGLVCADNDVVRLTHDQLVAHPLWRDFGDERHHHPPMRGWLAAPLVHSDGRNLGILQLSDRYEGEFTETDEALLVQLAQLASIAVEKAQLAGERDRQADRLRGLAEAAVAISSPLEMQEVLDRITRVAADLIGAHQAVTSLTVDRSWQQSITSTLLSDRYASWRDYAQQPDGSGIYARVVERNRTVRLTQRELERHPDFLGFGDHATDHPPMRGWLAVPLATVAGESLGLIQLSDRFEGEFTADDQALLEQLAQLASVAIENARLHEQLVHQERQQLTEDLLAGVSHDMQTPLAIILGAAAALADTREAPAEERLQLAVLLETQAHRLHQLVQQFLDYVRLEAGEAVVPRRDAVPLAPLTAELRALFSTEGRLEIELGAAVPTVAADEDRLSQVLVNLVGNALKFTSGPVRLHADTDADHVAISVIDDGPGIAPEEQDRVFHKLYRGEQARRARVAGQGLGLYVSRTLVEAMDGTLTVSSTLGEGCCFTVRLPAAGSHGHGPNAPDPVGRGSGHGAAVTRT